MISAKVGAAIRRERERQARLLGTHTDQEWQQLVAEFDRRCVKCGRGDRNVEKDHIRQLYRGGCDCIENIQPMCAWCNSGKGRESFNWAHHRRVNGFEMVPD